MCSIHTRSAMLSWAFFRRNAADDRFLFFGGGALLCYKYKVWLLILAEKPVLTDALLADQPV